ncbi:helix-turn-helix domain-containing protein [Enterococcus faecalis]|uniref:helix-turn-helix domain-containing protein n=1 Tax=Enterococcus TaxID=1350 RepID=UPI000DEA08D3|nr:MULTISPECIES: helix-turn-helix domain-containing protein [Enterococcus]EHQ2599787.1 helix-turn-helix domain-containing protein [Enterococcus faecalis]EHZ5372532.1 helix-turn-helix domain-containing protein [Enterococcus faecalis]EIW2077454.1 helix-turn-helix domain-containing protein [Enterococcus faecalis]EJU8176364.1 helix-turn-helix domain-containing protein [Enterococcus faecalis]MCD4891534.1 helix-turn-helix domain-containing protein [Enterococcus faecalis]
MIMPFVSVETIEAASSGDSIAMDIVLSNYKNYISRVAMKQVFVEEKGMVMYVDEYMRRQLETKLIEKILEFDTTR